jgi:hypothetical protein
MSIKITVSRIVATEETQIEIPDRCPNAACGADLTESSSAAYSLAPTQMNDDLVNMAIVNFEMAVRMDDVDDFHRRFEAAVRERAA